MKIVRPEEAGAAGDGSGRAPQMRSECLEGVFQANAKGFGFVTVEGMDADLFIPEGMTGTALDGDLVAVQLRPSFEGSHHSGHFAPSGKDGRQHRQEAEVIRVTKRRTTRIVGTFYGAKGAGCVIPDNRRIPADVRIDAGSTMGAVNGHKVVVRITDYGKSAPAGHHGQGAGSGPKLSGRVEEILGHMDDPGVDILSIIRAYELPEAFPDEVMRQVRKIPQTIPSSASVLPGREDWRDVLTVTIDGPDTKDIDDAVTVRRLDEENAAWELGVHIADVAQYVCEGTPLDREALHRATSNYLVDRVIPMLPHELSNGICSLNPGEDRLALSCIMKLDPSGNIVDSRVVETIIRSDSKLSYPGVMKLFEEKDESEILEQLGLQGIRRGAKTRSHSIAAMLRRGRRLSRILSRKRTADGAIDFEFPECKIYLDEQGQVTDIVPYDRNEATMMIENFMVAANETVAKTFCRKGIPFVYRTHAKPQEEKLRQLKQFVEGYGVRFRWSQGEAQPKELQKLLAGLKGRPEEAAISVKTLRSMQRAVYTTSCGGHFGLALEYYCHFTSPIRRYPDLQIHRIIKDLLHGKLDGKRIAHYEEILPQVCEQCSQMERRADEAERETDKQKMCEYMQGHLGEVFEGAVSGVTGWGLYVQLPNTIEGMIPVRSLRDDYYHYDEDSLRLIGERTGKAYGLGQTIRVVVASVDTTARKIDFEPEEILPDQGQAERKQPHRAAENAHRSGRKRGHRN